MKIRFKIILGILLFTFFAKVQTTNAQLVLLRTDSIIPLQPIIMNDTVDFEVHVAVKNLISLLPDIAVGNIFYWYRTDSMINSGQPARMIDLDLGIELVNDGFIDTVPIEMKPNELRMGGTNPINLIILWPALIPTNLDTLPDTLGITVVGYLGEDTYPKQVGNVIFPCPAFQYINIQQVEISKIREVTILSMEGKVVINLENKELSNGFINLESFPPGEYFVRTEYFDHRVLQTKIIKR